MNVKKFSDAMSELDTKYIDEALNYKKKAKRRNWIKWGAMAACLCFVVVGSILFNLHNLTDFNAMIGKTSVDTVAIMTSVPVDEWTAWYQQINLSEKELEIYVGDEYLKTDSRTWYFPDDVNNLKYLICKDAGDSLTLWMFISFATEEVKTYTYGDVLSIIYGVHGADDIVSITTSPFQANNTDEGKAIQKKIGTHTNTDREAINMFYNIVKDVICYGADGEDPANETRFSYSFSTENSDKLTSGESTYGTRRISIEFKNGTILDSWKYSALSGSFFEYGGIYTEPLEENDVYALNDIFGIK